MGKFFLAIILICQGTFAQSFFGGYYSPPPPNYYSSPYMQARSYCSHAVPLRYNSNYNAWVTATNRCIGQMTEFYSREQARQQRLAQRNAMMTVAFGGLAGAIMGLSSASPPGYPMGNQTGAPAAPMYPTTIGM